jgi:hypothetical protein
LDAAQNKTFFHQSIHLSVEDGERVGTVSFTTNHTVSIIQQEQMLVSDNHV